MLVKNLDQLNEIGIYIIRNIKNNKCYIGSTSQNFKIRREQHLYELKNQKHKNKYLQHSWNKYGEDCFIYDILEICERDVLLEREQYYLDLYKSFDKKYGYNINPFATGTNNLPKDVIKRRTESFTETINNAMNYYYKLKDGIILENDIPEKYRKIVFSKMKTPIWNKGITSNEWDYSYLKGIKKTKTETYIQGRISFKEKMRSKSCPIEIYDINNNYLGTWRSATDIYEFSLTDDNNLPVILRNPSGRNGLKPSVLKCQNILNVARGLIPHYKGLIFKFKCQ